MLEKNHSGELNYEGRLYLDKILKASTGMSGLINNLLEFSKVSYLPPASQVDLNFVVTQVLSELDLRIDEANATIHTDHLPEIQGSFTSLKQVFTNLISNSLKFSRNGVAPQIEITSSMLAASRKSDLGLDDGYEYAEIHVRDNGIGFENEYALHIFNKFSRLNGRSEYPGSGIGLAICKKIIERHHGSIWAEGVPGEGAWFHIVLPLS
ncbi:MAG: hypothetical protein EOO00_09200 [Chitinophagaceae bacterium]|nr:MAG: hypothetical protein EOO00_09200 [Chitinophagaceae bacterium]